MTNDQQMQEIEVSIADAKQKIADRDLLRKLIANSAFKRIIMERYLKEEAVRLVHLKSEPMDEANKTAVDNMMFGIGSLDRFFRTVLAEGAEMEQALIDSELERDNILAEEIN